MLVTGSISSIIMAPMRLISAMPLSVEKTFRSIIDSTMLAVHHYQPFHLQQAFLKYINLDHPILIQKDRAAAQCAMVEQKLVVNIEEAVHQLSHSCKYHQANVRKY